MKYITIKDALNAVVDKEQCSTSDINIRIFPDGSGSLVKWDYTGGAKPIYEWDKIIDDSSISSHVVVHINKYLEGYYNVPVLSVISTSGNVYNLRRFITEGGLTLVEFENDITKEINTVSMNRIRNYISEFNKLSLGLSAYIKMSFVEGCQEFEIDQVNKVYNHLSTKSKTVMRQETLQNLNNQKVFDIAAAHLLVQGKQGLANNGGMCAYRGHDGAKCAVGIVIPDEMYLESMEGMGVHQLLTNFTEVKNHFENCDTDLLEDMQSAHDGLSTYDFPIDTLELFRTIIKKEFNRIATKFGLDASILDVDQDNLVDKLMEETNNEYQTQLECVTY